MKGGSAGSTACMLVSTLTVGTVAAIVGLAEPGSSDATGAPAVAYPTGRAVFQANCAVCHGPAGAGIPSLAPSLSSYPAHYAASVEGRRQLAMTVLHGMIGDITVGDSHYNFQMPDFARLDDATLAAVLNFVVFDLAHAPADVQPLTPHDITAERAHAMDGAAVHEHRKSVVPSRP